MAPMKLLTPQKKMLLSDARLLVDRVKSRSGGDSQKVLNMSSLALSYLLRGHSLSQFEELLQAGHASKVSQTHWQAFVTELRPVLIQLRKRVPNEEHCQAMLYLLGWLHRLRS